MGQERIFKVNLKQLEETFTEYLDTTNIKDKLTRLREAQMYLRNITLTLERIENEQLRTAPHLAARRIVRIYREINP